MFLKRLKPSERERKYANRLCEFTYAEPISVHVDTPRDPPNGIHRLRDGIDWEKVERENAYYNRKRGKKNDGSARG